MSVAVATLAVTTSSTILFTAPTKPADGRMGEFVWIRNVTASTAEAFIGPSGVTTATGFPIAPGQTIGPIELQSGEALYAVAAAAATATLKVLRHGV